MADDQISVSDATGESLKTKFQEFLGGLSEEESALFAAMVAGGETQEQDDVAGYWFSWGGWNNWWGSSYSGVVASGSANVISTGGGNLRGW